MEGGWWGEPTPDSIGDSVPARCRPGEGGINPHSHKVGNPDKRITRSTSIFLPNRSTFAVQTTLTLCLVVEESQYAN